MNNSIWAEQSLPRFPVLEGDRKTDVLVIGGGLAGLLCARKLKDAGVEVMLIEADRIMHGISRNTTGKITSQHGLIYQKLLQQFDGDIARGYWAANERAIETYRQLSRRYPCDLETRDNYIYSADDPGKIEKELEALQKLGIPGELALQLPIPVSTAGAVRFREQAQFHPVKLAAGMVGDLNIFEGTTAREFGKHTVVTDRGRIRAEKVIVATHFPILNKHGAYFLKLYQDRSYVLGLEDGGNVDGMYLEDGKAGLSFRNQGRMLLIGGGGHRTGKSGGGWSELETFVQRHYPQGKVRYRWAAQDCMSLDGIPYIGQYSPRTPNLYVATGFNKWGMSSSVVAAEILCDLVQDREHPYAPVFDPSRSILRPQILVNGLESTMNLLRPTVPRCPHLGCALRWNSAEHSWDCPCHGSRFDQNGTLLDNPATGNLKGAAGPEE